jgi:hypothetical protein
MSDKSQTSEEVEAFAEAEIAQKRYRAAVAKLETGVQETFGCSSETMKDEIQKAAKLAAAFGADVVGRTVMQALHNHFVNLPAGILDRLTATARHATTSGIVGAVGAFVGWNIDEALAFCRDVLDDVNAHKAAKQVEAMRKRL